MNELAREGFCWYGLSGGELILEYDFWCHGFFLLDAGVGDFLVIEALTALFVLSMYEVLSEFGVWNWWPVWTGGWMVVWICLDFTYVVWGSSVIRGVQGYSQIYCTDKVRMSLLWIIQHSRQLGLGVFGCVMVDWGSINGWRYVRAHRGMTYELYCCGFICCLTF